jgi:hypothetical protein
MGMSGVDALWQELAASALLGTDRHPPVLPASSGDLAHLLGKLDPSNTRHFLLECAAVVALYRQAGRQPLSCPDGSPPSCGPEDLDRCSAAAGSRLAALLGGTYPELIPEWLVLGAASGKRAPEELLPEVLDWGENHTDQIDLILPVLGNRGRWLAAQIPWGQHTASAVFAASIPLASAHTVWQTGRKAVRRYLFRRERQSHPGEARELLASTWSEESAEERAVFLGYLEAGLSMADEPFLEAALDDRSKEVRKAAADLLAHLPGSRLVGRQFDRAQALLKWKPPALLRKAQIVVTLPEACDKDMVRDGVNPKRPAKALGEKGDWLYQILRTIPPSIWNKQWSKIPAELFDAAGAGDWKDLLHESWIEAAVNFQDPDWAEAILRLYPGRTELLQALPPARRLAFLISQINKQPQEGLAILALYREPWGPELTGLALPHLRGYYPGDQNPARLASFRASFLAFGRYMDPTMATEAARILYEKSERDSAWGKAVETLLQILDFRHRMVEELR